jgi:hypothetical protein
LRLGLQARATAIGQTAWSKTILHAFAAAHGTVPEGKLLLDSVGAVYGMTYQGGTGLCTDTAAKIIGCGVMYKLTPPPYRRTGWTESVIHTFHGPDGAYPRGGLIMDASGSLYGAASGGGPISYGMVGGYGLIFKFAPPSSTHRDWTETVLYNFDVDTTGTRPIGELVRDSAERLFGVTNGGGPKLGGTVFEIAIVGYSPKSITYNLR